MLTVAVLAVLLAGDSSVTQEDIQILPIGRTLNSLIALPAPAPPVTDAPKPPPGPKASIDIGVGWVVADQADPFGRYGLSSFSTAYPLASGRIRGQTWYAEFAGQLARSSLTNRNVTASVGRDIGAIGRVRWGLNAEFADVRFRHDDFQSGDVTVGTNRTATIGLAGLSFGIGPYRGASVRLSVLGGYYRNRYGSVVDLPGFTGGEPLAVDELPVYGGRLAVDGVTIGNRFELGGSVRFLHLTGRYTSSFPNSELSGTFALNIRLFGIGRKQLFIGGLGRYGPAQPSLITDKTFGLRGIWKLR